MRAVNSGELGGEDTYIFFPLMNTTAWALSFIIANLLAWLKRRTGSWTLLFCGPVVVRLVAAVVWQRHASVTPVRERILAARAAEEKAA